MRRAPGVERQPGVRPFPDRETRDVAGRVVEERNQPCLPDAASEAEFSEVRVKTSSAPISALSRLDNRFARVPAVPVARRIALSVGSRARLSGRSHRRCSRSTACCNSVARQGHDSRRPTPMQGVSTIPSNARHLNCFPRQLSTTDPMMASRQERQIVQSCMNLDDFLPGFRRSWRHLISVRSVVRIYPGPFFLPLDPNLRSGSTC